MKRPRPPLTRSETMRRVKSRDTTPELRVRRALRDAGWTGYRLDRKDLPGRPDIAFIGRRKAIFVHGCFWHGHTCKRGAREPKTNAEYWRAKIGRNMTRDAAAVEALDAAGWRVLILWECQIRDMDSLKNSLIKFMSVNHKSLRAASTR